MFRLLVTKHFFTASAILVLLLVAILAIIYPVRCVPWNVMICGPNEGWNAYFAQAAMHGEGLYPHPDQLITNNYPPLSFYTVGLLGVVLGDPILAGRWIAFLSLLTISFFIFKIVRELGGERSGGIVGASFFVATMGLFFERYVAMNDPQLLALAIIIAGFYLFLKALKHKKRYFLAFAMMVFAGFFKQNIIMFPLSALLWLLVRKEQNIFWKCLVYSIILIAAGFALCYACYGSGFFFNFFAPRRFFGAQAMVALLDLQSIGLAAIISSLVLWKYRRENNVVLLLILLAVGLASHFLQRVGSGVDSNSQFDFNIAVALAVGTAFHLLLPFSRKDQCHSSELPQTFFVMLLLAPLFLAPGMSLVQKGLSSHFNEEARWREQCMLENIKKVQATPGDVLSEPYILYRAGKSFIVDGFNLEERIQAGSVSPTVLLNRVKQHQLTKVNTDANDTWPYKDFNFLRLKYRFQQWPNAADRLP